MTAQPFITSYKDDENVHIYFFPGRDEKGYAIARMSFLTSITDYKYTRQSDGSIEYILNGDTPKTISCRLQNISTGETKDNILEL